MKADADKVARLYSNRTGLTTALQALQQRRNVNAQAMKAQGTDQARRQTLIDEGKEIDILKPEEVRALFPADRHDVWADETHCVLNKLAACTGMRLGELLGLRGEYLFDGYITVAGQHGRFGYGDTKTYKPRNITIPEIIENDLQRLKDKNGDGYLFSNDGGKKPRGIF